MKVLLLHQHFKTPYKGGAIRSYYLARALVENDIQVIVITAHGEKTGRTELLDGIEVHYLPVAYDNRFGFFDRIVSFLKYAWRATRLASKFKDADLCYAISVPLTVGLAAMWIKTRQGIPFVFEVGDLWPEAPIQLGFIRNPLVVVTLRLLEKQIYQAANTIVALSPAIRDEVLKKAPAKRVELIPNMADCDYFKIEAKNSSLESKFAVAGKFVVSYVGAIGVANGLDYFLECAHAARKAALPIHFLLCGDGALLERLKRNASHLKLQNLTFVDFTHREGVREVLNVSDAVFVCYKPVPILETGSPNKFFDGLAAGKLILVNFGGWIRKEVEDSHCGIFVDPHQPADFIKKISPFLADPRLLAHYQEAARALAEQKYSRQALGRQFAKFIELQIPEFP